jgi:hypothetical protein
MQLLPSFYDLLKLVSFADMDAMCVDMHAAKMRFQTTADLVAELAAGHCTDEPRDKLQHN